MRTYVRVPYVELHCHSAYSFLDGASLPVELAAAAAEQGYPALALTDHDGLHGAMEFAQAAKPLGIRPITGAELTLDDGSHLTLLCEDRDGLSQPLPADHARARGHAPERGRREPLRAAVSLDDVERHAEGLVCLSGCARDGALAGRVERASTPRRAGWRGGCSRAFGPERFRIELQRPFARHDRAAQPRCCAELAERLGVACVATGNVHVHARSRAPLQDAFVAVRLGAHARRVGAAAARQHARTCWRRREAMAERFAEHPERGARVRPARGAARVRPDQRPRLPLPGLGGRRGADRKLAEICRARLERALPERRSRARARARGSRRSCAVIRKLGLSGFFLLHRDMLELAREVAVEVRGPSRRARCCRRGAGAARASPRSSATSPASRTSTRSRTISSWAASSTRSSRRCRTSTSTSRATSARC